MDLFIVLLALFEKATAAIGIQTPDARTEQVMSLAAQIAPNKPIRYVRDWVIVDLTHSSKKDAELMQSMGLQSKFLFSLDVIYDQTGMVPEGGYIRSTMCKNFRHGCIFETRNTLYVLIGEGKRISLSQSEALNLFSLR